MNINELKQCADQKGIAETMTQFGTSIKIQLPISGELAAMNIDELSLSTRSFNALKRAGVNTVNELVDVIANDKLKEIRNLGRKCTSEIKTVILTAGYAKLNDSQKNDFWSVFISQNYSI